MREVQLTNRMKKVADMVSHGGVVADIGCDHAYVSIYLIKNAIANNVIAMDIRTGPLKIALENVNKYECDKGITVVQSNGLEKLNKGQVDSIIIAGMGGILIASILEEGKEVLGEDIELVLQPQSDYQLLREKLHELGFEIIEEDMLVELGKYYVIIKAKKSDDKDINYNQLVYYKYGKLLLEKKHIILKEFLQKEEAAFQKVLNGLVDNDSLKVLNRKNEIEEEICIIKEALKFYDM